MPPVRGAAAGGGSAAAAAAAAGADGGGDAAAAAAADDGIGVGADGGGGGGGGRRRDSAAVCRKRAPRRPRSASRRRRRRRRPETPSAERPRSISSLGFFFIKLSFLSFLWRMTWSRRGKKSSFSFLCQKKLIKKKSKEHVRYDASRRKFRMTSHSTGSCPIHVSKLDRKELQVAICNEKPPKKNKKQKKAVLTLDIRRTFPDFVSTGKSFFF